MRFARKNTSSQFSSVSILRFSSPCVAQELAGSSHHTARPDREARTTPTTLSITSMPYPFWGPPCHAGKPVSPEQSRCSSPCSRSCCPRRGRHPLHLLVVQVFVRTPSGQRSAEFNSPVCWQHIRPSTDPFSTVPSCPTGAQGRLFPHRLQPTTMSTLLNIAHRATRLKANHANLRFRFV